MDINRKRDCEGVYDIDINIRIRGQVIEFSYDQCIVRENTKGQTQNEAIFGGLIKILNNLDEDVEYVKISSNLSHIINGINDGKINKANGNFSKYKFISLKYKNIYGEQV